jgi:hypothetical protein
MVNIGENEWLIVCNQGFVSKDRFYEALDKDGCVWKRVAPTPYIEDTHSRLDSEVDITALIFQTRDLVWMPHRASKPA